MDHQSARKNLKTLEIELEMEIEMEMEIEQDFSDLKKQLTKDLHLLKKQGQETLVATLKSIRKRYLVPLNFSKSYLQNTPQERIEQALGFLEFQGLLQLIICQIWDPDILLQQLERIQSQYQFWSFPLFMRTQDNLSDQKRIRILKAFLTDFQGLNEVKEPVILFLKYHEQEDSQYSEEEDRFLDQASESHQEDIDDFARSFQSSQECLKDFISKREWLYTTTITKGLIHEKIKLDLLFCYDLQRFPRLFLEECYSFLVNHQPREAQLDCLIFLLQENTFENLWKYQVCFLHRNGLSFLPKGLRDLLRLTTKCWKLIGDQQKDLASQTCEEFLLLMVYLDLIPVWLKNSKLSIQDWDSERSDSSINDQPGVWQGVNLIYQNNQILEKLKAYHQLLKQKIWQKIDHNPEEVLSTILTSVMQKLFDLQLYELAICFLRVALEEQEQEHIYPFLYLASQVMGPNYDFGFQDSEKYIIDDTVTWIADELIRQLTLIRRENRTSLRDESCRRIQINHVELQQKKYLLYPEIVDEVLQSLVAIILLEPGHAGIYPSILQPFFQLGPEACISHLYEKFKDSLQEANGLSQDIVNGCQVLRSLLIKQAQEEDDLEDLDYDSEELQKNMMYFMEKGYNFELIKDFEGDLRRLSKKLSRVKTKSMAQENKLLLLHYQLDTKGLGKMQAYFLTFQPRKDAQTRAMIVQAKAIKNVKRFRREINQEIGEFLLNLFPYDSEQEQPEAFYRFINDLEAIVPQAKK